MEARFIEMMESLKPMPRHLILFREIVLDVWSQRHAQGGTLRRKLEQRVAALRERIDRPAEVYAHAKSIDRETYEAYIAWKR